MVSEMLSSFLGGGDNDSCCSIRRNMTISDVEYISVAGLKNRHKRHYTNNIIITPHLHLLLFKTNFKHNFILVFQILSVFPGAVYVNFLYCFY